jgi:hypothetical protein
MIPLYSICQKKLEYFTFDNSICNNCIHNEKELTKYQSIMLERNDTLYTYFSCPCNKDLVKIEHNKTIYKGLNFEYYYAYRNEINDSIISKTTYFENGFINEEKITKKYDFSKSITHLDDGYNETTYKNNNFLDYSYRKFHENGQLKESGFYDLKSVTDTIDIYYSPIPIFDDGIKAIQVTKEAVKHGVWLFYNRKGKIIKREIYYYGELVKN